jgi:hypothetical protein
MNSKKEGLVTFVTAQAKDTGHYVGFCYELGIVVEGDNRDRLLDDLYDAVQGYIRVTRENDLSDAFLDRHDVLPNDLQELYDIVRSSISSGEVKPSNRKKPSNYEESIRMGGAQLSVACV